MANFQDIGAGLRSNIFCFLRLTEMINDGRINRTIDGENFPVLVLRFLEIEIPKLGLVEYFIRISTRNQLRLQDPNSCHRLLFNRSAEKLHRLRNKILNSSSENDLDD